MNEQYFVFGSLFDYCDVMCSDLLSLQNCQYINCHNYINGYPMKYIHKIHNSGIANRLGRLPFRAYWYKYYFDMRKIVSGGHNIFVFFDSNPHAYDFHFLEWIRKNVEHAVISILFVNAMNRRNMRDIEYFRNHFDVIYTTDKEDAQRHNFIHIVACYSKISLGIINVKSIDALFVGADKGRAKFLCDLYVHLLEKGLSCDFTITGLEVVPPGISTKRLAYEEVLQKIVDSKILVEICSEGQSGLNLRAIEAIVYDKVLITNNGYVKETPFYNPSKMIVISSADDLKRIDFNSIDHFTGYEYNNCYSPTALLFRVLDDYYARGEGNN